MSDIIVHTKSEISANVDDGGVELIENNYPRTQSIIYINNEDIPTLIKYLTGVIKSVQS